MEEGCVRRDTWNWGHLRDGVGVIFINDTLPSFSYAMRGYISICVSNRLVININFIERLLFLGKT